MALYIANNDNKMTFFGNIVYLSPCSVICVPRCARPANDTTRAQINNIPSKSHVIPLLISRQVVTGLKVSRVSFLLTVNLVDIVERDYGNLQGKLTKRCGEREGTPRRGVVLLSVTSQTEVTWYGYGKLHDLYTDYQTLSTQRNTKMKKITE